MAQLQTSRPIAITTPLGDDVLLFHRMTATEELGRLFEFDLDLFSTDQDITFEDILGQNVTIRIMLQDGSERYFNGFVTQFRLEGSVGDYYAYSMTVHPWLWFLTRTSDCRIFQEMTVPDIIKAVFRDHGFTDFEEALIGNYRDWEYCVQYRETDFNFVSRLMEQEGIYYYFKHENNKHTLVLSDSISAHEPFPGYETLSFYPPDDHVRPEEDHVYGWSVTQEIKPGTYALNDYDFKAPKANLQVKSTISQNHAYADMEIYDYPGEYPDAGDGEAYARARIEALQMDQEVAQAQGHARGIAVGSLFELTNYPRDDQNREYLVVSAVHQMESDDYISGRGDDSGPQYSCNFNAIASKNPYRSAQTTPKPAIQGPQTAVVVGPSGDEIHTDTYGRVKVQFHWDRYGKQDENSSCWVRVSHPTAGKGWGAVQIPRIGQEVIVEFIEGDPDHPIITGRVYNNDNMPPYELPANATQSGMKSRSSKGGSPDNFNEIRFEDKKGEELVYIHAEKDQARVVENDEAIQVGNDRSETIGRDRSLEVGRDKSETVKHNKTIVVAEGHTETINGSMSISVGATLTESVLVNYAETVGGAMELTVGGALAITVGGLMAETVGGQKAESIGGGKSETIGGGKTTKVGKSFNQTIKDDHIVDIGKNLKVKVKEKHEETIEKEYILKAKKIQIVAKDEILIKAGKAEIMMKKNGDITVKGNKINLKGSGDVIVKGSKVKGN